MENVWQLPNLCILRLPRICWNSQGPKTNHQLHSSSSLCCKLPRKEQGQRAPHPRACEHADTAHSWVRGPIFKACASPSLHLQFLISGRTLHDNVGARNPQPRHLNSITFNISTLNIVSLAETLLMLMQITRNRFKKGTRAWNELSSWNSRRRDTRTWRLFMQGVPLAGGAWIHKLHYAWNGSWGLWNAEKLF